jgi:AAA+ ATPase superfamily predicted ATPase
VLLRCLAVEGLVPEPNSTNQISRLALEVCEKAAPQIVSFLKIDKKLQTYEKFPILRQCHHEIMMILKPVSDRYGDLSALISARREVNGALSHSIVREYCSIYRLNEIKSIIESIFGALHQILQLDMTLLSTITECNRRIEAARADFVDSETFLSVEVLNQFLNTCEALLSAFFQAQRAKFETKIILASSPELEKHYPLQVPGKELHIALPLRNVGSGLATDVRVTFSGNNNDVALANKSVALGNVLPGEFSATVAAEVINASQRFSALAIIEWGQIGSPSRQEDVLEFNVSTQRGDIDWQGLEYQTPYTTGIAEGVQFFGRMEKVHKLASRLLRQQMEPFYITGQKRLGKTSLALASARYALSKSAANTFYFQYILWGEIAHSDPIASLRQLGETIEEFIISYLPEGSISTKGDYNGSLAALIKLAKTAKKVSPYLRFAIIIDEFDEIHPDLYMHGNLADTFFQNLRALSRSENLCIVLVGGENMPFIMDRQGQKLNNFSKENLNYFSRQTEWADFQLIVREPTKGTLNWHNDAISEIFNTTSGNPYFSKILCASAFRRAVFEKDADITAIEVRRATEAAISGMGANSFAHLWQDGIAKSASEREPDILRRMRTLVAIAFCLRRGMPATAHNIMTNRSSLNLSEVELTAVLNDFHRREVLGEENRTYVLVLPVFQSWLVDVGVSQLIADSLNEELANSVIIAENEASVRSEEIVSLAERWPTYRGRQIGTDEIKMWLNQVESQRDQRQLFELLKRVRFYSESLIRERLRSAHALLRQALPEFVIRRKTDRRVDVVVTFVDGEGKSGASHASAYAEENGIASECVIGPGDFRMRYARHIEKNGSVAAVVIIDDIAATGRTLAENISNFLGSNGDMIAQAKIRVIALVSTVTVQETILNKMRSLTDVDIDFRSCEVLDASAYAFPGEGEYWRSEDDEQRAKSLCINLGSRICRQNPLGFGGLGLLVVFPTTVPNNSLPILHSFARTGSQKSWRPLFLRVVN